MHAAETDLGVVVHHAVVGIETARALEIVDVTPLVAAVVAQRGWWDGVALVQTRHTTTGLLLNEHEPLLAGDLTALLERLAPAQLWYAHDDFPRRSALEPGERANGAAHCRAALLRASESLAVAGGGLRLGRWQRLLFVECDGPRHREVSVTCLGIGRDRPRVPA